MECFHSRGQHLCKFIGTKESVCIRKEFNSNRIGLEHQHGRRDVMWKRSIAFFNINNDNKKNNAISIPVQWRFTTTLKCFKNNIDLNNNALFKNFKIKLSVKLTILLKRIKKKMNKIE